MFIVARGSCSAFVHDQELKHKDFEFMRKIPAGEVFGEISMLYGCKRTATVISNNYCQLAKISAPHVTCFEAQL